MKSRIAITLGFALLSAAAFAQSTASASANVTTWIYIPIALSANSTALSFGDVFPGGAPGTVVMDPASPGAVASFSGSGLSLGTTHAVSVPTFTVTGTNNKNFAVTLPTSVTLNAAGGQMTVDHFKGLVSGGSDSTTPTGTLSATGSSTFMVGATLEVGGGQAQGDYTGSFTVNVAYD